MPEQAHPANHVNRRQIVLHEIRSSQVQNVQTVDRVQFLLGRMQSGDWPRTLRDLRTVCLLYTSDAADE